MDFGRLEAVPPGTVHLDTVRALHQTVVSLRTALEVSKNELKELKEKYQQHSQCTEYADVIEKLTLENHVLRRRIIDSEYNDDDGSKVGQNIKLEVTYSPRSQRESDRYSEIVIKTATPDVDSELIEEKESISAVSEEGDNIFCSSDNLNKNFEEISETELEPEHEIEIPVESSTSSSPHHETQLEEPPSHISRSRKDSNVSCDSNFKTKLELLSKFDVRIKVRTIKEGTIISSTTSETDSSGGERDKKKTDKPKSTVFEENREYFEETEQEAKDNQIKVKSVSTENIKMAVPNEAEAKSKTDKFDVQVRITSEENLMVKEGFDKETARKKDTLNLDVDDLSFRSMSEGDNSVFSEAMTPVEEAGAGVGGGEEDKQYDQEASGNESEEVDDIELIFTTDESKDMSDLKEDLVSIREAEPWSPSHISTTHSTPVLIKFHTLDPDFQPGGETRDNFENENQENCSLQGAIAESSLKQKRVSLPSADKDIIRHVGFNQRSLDLPNRGILKSCDNKSDNMLYKRSPNTSSRRLDSVDSLTCEYNRNMSLDTTKSSSFELGSSMDILQRDESVDSFHRNAHLGHRFSVFAETDISKCGISEDDLSGNLNMRRNTCPNPFQYRPPYRTITRPIGPFKATAAPSYGARPILRESSAVRRENVAQTDVSALPPRWSSDGYLAHKVGFSVATTLPTLPQRTPAPPTTRRLTIASLRPPPPRTDHTRRQLLSDIGFTSMVPELSRSADPLWALEQRACSSCGAEPTPPHSGEGSTAKYIARGRSPYLSIDKSNDWTPQLPQQSYVPSTRVTSHRMWRSSLPDVRGDDTDELIDEAETFLRRSIDNLQAHTEYESESQLSRPYIPAEPRHLRLGHAVKIITPQGRIAVGRVRYVGLAGDTAANSTIMVGCILPLASYPGLPLNEGTHRGRRYFHAPAHHTALFVPFSKVVMAWAN